MTPQERADLLIAGIYHERMSRQEIIDYLTALMAQTRRAALLEAANAMRKRYDESYDWSPLIENTIAELKRLAQEG